MPQSYPITTTLEGARKIRDAVRRVIQSPERVPADARELLRTLRPNVMFACKVRQVGGSAGSGSTDCTFTYDVYSLAGVQLNTSALAPKRRRFATVQYVAPPNDSIGCAYVDETGTLQLWDPNELPSLTTCA
jgi:hypothetical protein